MLSLYSYSIPQSLYWSMLLSTPESGSDEVLAKLGVELTELEYYTIASTPGKSLLFRMRTTEELIIILDIRGRLVLACKKGDFAQVLERLTFLEKVEPPHDDLADLDIQL